MSEFKSSCPHCGQHIQCDERWSGRQIKCPSCTHLIVIPPSPQHAAAGRFEPQSGLTWATFVAPPNVEKPKGISLKKGDGAAPPPEAPSAVV